MKILIFFSYRMLPVMPSSLMPGMVLALVLSVAVVESVERGPLPSGMVASVVGSVAMVVGMVAASVVGAVVTAGMVVGVVTAGLELRQPQPAITQRVRTSSVMRIIAFFI